MKTIKELSTMLFRDEYNLGQLATLKDVLELIDERIGYLIECKSLHERFDELEELKVRITG